MSSIKWQTTLGYAEDSAISTRKPILLYYFDPECIGCKQMDEVTFSSEEVIRFVNEHLICLKIDLNKKEVYEKYNTIWTPSFIVLDYQGHEIQQTIGYLDPDRFIARMLLGKAKVHISNGEFDTANVSIKRLIERFPDSVALPEAIFFKGVNLSKQTNNPSHLKNAYEELVENYPDTSWTVRAEPYRFLC